LSSKGSAPVAAGVLLAGNRLLHQMVLAPLLAAR